MPPRLPPPGSSGFVEPCLPSRAAEPPRSAGWIHEIKYDGFRMMAQRRGSAVRLNETRGKVLGSEAAVRLRIWAGILMNAGQLILKRSSMARRGFDDYDVLSEGKVVGRIYHDRAIGSDKPWFWGLAMAITRTARQRTAIRRAAKPRWQRSRRAGGGSRFTKGSAKWQSRVLAK